MPAEAPGAWRLLATWARPRVREVRWGFLMGMVWSSCAVAVPLVARAGVDNALRGDGARAMLELTGALLALAALKGGALRIRRYMVFTASARLSARLRADMFARLHVLDAAYHEGTTKGRVLGALSDDTQQVEQFGVSLQVLMNNIVWAVLIAIALVVIDPWLALLAALPLPLVLLASRRFTMLLGPSSDRLRDTTLALGSVATDAIDGIAVVKGLGTERHHVHAYDNGSAAVYDEALAASDIRAWYVPLIEALPSLSLALVLLVGGTQVADGTLTLGDFTAFNTYVVMALWPLRFTGVIVGQASRARLAVERIAELLHAEPSLAAPATKSDSALAAASPPAAESGASPAADSAPAADSDSAPAALELRDVRFSYTSGTPPVLDGLTLRVAPGELVALAGATGSGKSTLAALLTRVHDADAGSVAVAGRDVRDWDPTALRAAVRTVHDDTFLFSRSIRDNLLLARPDAGDDDLATAARLAALEDVVAALDGGWSARAGEGGARLSGGQRQRVALARALLARSRALILDDVTSALDARTERRVVAALPAIRTDRTILVISDRAPVLAAADRVVLLHGGRIVADGPHDVLAATSAAYRRRLLGAVEAAA